MLEFKYETIENLPKSKYTPRDLEDHLAISILITNANHEILVFKHNKFNLVSVPIGKVDEGSTPVKTLITELEEECGIIPVKYELISICRERYRRLGNWVNCENYVFKVIQYDGIISNCEPDKHSNLHFASVPQLLQICPSERTNSLNHILDLLTDTDVKRWW